MIDPNTVLEPAADFVESSKGGEPAHSFHLDRSTHVAHRPQPSSYLSSFSHSACSPTTTSPARRDDRPHRDFDCGGPSGTNALCCARRRPPADGTLYRAWTIRVYLTTHSQCSACTARGRRPHPRTSSRHPWAPPEECASMPVSSKRFYRVPRTRPTLEFGRTWIAISFSIRSRPQTGRGSPLTMPSSMRPAKLSRLS